MSIICFMTKLLNRHFIEAFNQHKEHQTLSSSRDQPIDGDTSLTVDGDNSKA